MSAAALHYDKFKRQVVRDGKVFTFTSEGEYLVYEVRGQDVIPFWSSRTRMETIQKAFPRHQEHDIAEILLGEFIRFLPKLAEQNIHVGTNWSGNRLVGYDVSVEDLLSGLEYWMSRNVEQ